MKIHRNDRWFLVKLLDKQRRLPLEQYRQGYIATGWTFEGGFMIPGRREFRDRVERLEEIGLIEVDSASLGFWQRSYTLTIVGIQHAYCSMIYTRNDHRYQAIQHAS